jgi:hypothetical protein
MLVLESKLVADRVIPELRRAYDTEVKRLEDEKAETALALKRLLAAQVCMRFARPAAPCR